MTQTFRGPANILQQSATEVDVALLKKLPAAHRGKRETPEKVALRQLSVPAG